MKKILSFVNKILNKDVNNKPIKGITINWTVCTDDKKTANHFNVFQYSCLKFK